MARALAQDAAILIADEPAAGLDPAHALVLFETLARIAAEGRAVIVALHDLSLALRYCPRAILMKDGRVAASGPARDVMTEALIARVYGIRACVAEFAGVPCVIPVSVRS
jgi:iron complex transport system ATP-binding protein